MNPNLSECARAEHVAKVAKRTRLQSMYHGAVLQEQQQNCRQLCKKGSVVADFITAALSWLSLSRSSPVLVADDKQNLACPLPDLPARRKSGVGKNPRLEFHPC